MPSWTAFVCYNSAVAEVGLPTAWHHDWGVMRMDSTRSEKACFKCGLVKPIDEFYRHPMMGDGRLGKCKACTKLDVAQNRRRRLGYYLDYDRERYRTQPKRQEAARRSYITQAKNNPQKVKAWRAFRYAVQAGVIVKADRCEDCGCRPKRIEGHHEDYGKPLEVVWLCPLCHGKRHRTVQLPPHMEVEEPPVTGHLFEEGQE